MEVSFRERTLEEVVHDRAKLDQLLGASTAARLRRRLEALREMPNLGAPPPDGQGFRLRPAPNEVPHAQRIRLDERHELIVAPDTEPVPLNERGEADLSRVTSIVVLRVKGGTGTNAEGELAPNVVAIVREDLSKRVLGLATFVSDTIAITTADVVRGQEVVSVAFPPGLHSDQATVSAVDEDVGLAVLKLSLPTQGRISELISVVRPPGRPTRGLDPITDEKGEALRDETGDPLRAESSGPLVPWSGHWYNPKADKLEPIDGTFDARTVESAGKEKLRLHVMGMKERGVSFVASGGGTFADGKLFGIMTDYASSYAHALRADTVLRSECLRKVLPAQVLGETGTGRQVSGSPVGKALGQQQIIDAIAHVSTEQGEAGLATLISPHFAVCSLPKLHEGDIVTITGFGRKPKSQKMTASCFTVGTNMPYQVLRLTEPAPKRACDAALQLTPPSDPDGTYSVFRYDLENGSFGKRTAQEGPPYGLGDARDLLTRIRIGGTPRGLDIEGVRGAPVLMDDKLVGVMVDRALEADGYYCMVPANNLMNDRWYRVVLSELQGGSSQSDEAQIGMGIPLLGAGESSQVLRLSDSYCTESTRYICMAGLELSQYAGMEALQEQHLLVCGLAVGARKAAFHANEDYAFVLLAHELGLSTQEDLSTFCRHQASHLATPDELSRLLNTIVDSVVTWEPVACAVSDEVAAILAAAQNIAEQTLKRREDRRIHQRHLLAAVLKSALRTGAPAATLFGNLDVSPESLGRRLAEVWSRLPSENPRAWERIFPAGESPTSQAEELVRPSVDQLAGVFSDNVSGDPDQLQDRLGIEPQAEAFARVVVARKLEPPLAIGLFGDWGTGKTYLMGLICKHVKQLADNQKAHFSETGDAAYCSNVVPILFNAWHYIDSNLWASLVTHIFDRLQEHVGAGRGSGHEQKRKDLFGKLASVKQDLADAERRKTLAKGALREAEGTLAARRDTINRARGKLAALSHFDPTPIVREALARPEIQAHLKLLGVEGLQESFDSLREAASECRTIEGRVSSVLSWVSRWPTWGLVVAIVSLVAIPYLSLVPWLRKCLDGAAAVMVPAGVWLAEICAIAVAGLRKIRPALEGVEKVRNQLDAAVEKRRTHDLKRAEVQRIQLDTDVLAYEKALDEVRKARRRVEEVEAEIDEISAGRRLRSFIEERCSSSEYREHLTIISTVRGDFEILSDLMLELRDEPDSAGRGVGEDAGQTCGKIDRIVLFIDDLDRCPPERVVQVLEAIHLLLAFPLFVVVVGVDYRWVENALVDRYLGDGPAAVDHETEKHRHYMRPRDYLEKIFQIPYHLPPMQDAGFAQLVDELLPASEEVRERVGEDDGAASTEGHPDLSSRDATGEESPPSGRVGIPQTPPHKVITENGVIIQYAEEAGSQVREDETSMAEALRIRTEETEFLKTLAWASPSPRVLKRITNVYRVIKAHEAATSERYADFVKSDGSGGEYQAVLILLVIENVYPEIADEILRLMLFSRDATKGGQPYSNWVDFVTGHATPKEEEGAEDERVATDREKESCWASLWGGLQRPEMYNLDLPMDAFRRWIPTVQSYSFSYGRRQRGEQPIPTAARTNLDRSH